MTAGVQGNTQSMIKDRKSTLKQNIQPSLRELQLDLLYHMLLLAQYCLYVQNSWHGRFIAYTEYFYYK